MRVMDVAVIGGGASGMAATIAALQSGKSVMLFEGNEKIGKKLLATGNGKCNFTHKNISSEYYHCNDKKVLDEIFSEFTTRNIVDWFQKLGMESKEKNGYYYPLSEQASTVLDVMQITIEEKKGVIVTQNPINELRIQNGLFILYKGKEKIAFRKCVLATGSFAGRFIKKQECDPYGCVRSLGLQMTKMYPSLTKGICVEKDIKLLSGVRAESVLSLYQDGRCIGSESGEVQFTAQGLSGIVFFQLSGHIAESIAEHKNMTIHMNIMPGTKKEEAYLILQKRYDVWKNRTIENFLIGIWNKKMTNFLCKRADLDCNALVYTYPLETIRGVIDLAYDVVFQIKAVATIEEAQVCRGGVSMTEINSDLSVKKIPGLFLCGELLNVDGICGGYNLHWAWASGIAAGRNAAI